MKKLLLNAFIALTFMLSGTQKANAGVYNICSITDTQDSTGTLYDTGGPTGIYQVNEDCTLLVHPSCAVSITLSFQSFDTESGFDEISVFDGTTTSAPMLLQPTSGTALPATVTATSGSMLIVWTSDVSITGDGFACSWTSVIAPSIAPIAAFASASNTPPLGVPNQFNDQSTNGPTGWLWDFGDGDTSHRQNPFHAFVTPGTFTVTLIAFSCTESDTITHTVTVQGAPNIDVDPLSGFTANAQCGDSITFDLDVSNTGSGQLVYNTSGTLIGPTKVLAMTYGVDQFTEYLHTLNAINQHFTNYTLTSTGTIDPGVLSGLLTGKNVLLICEQETGSPAVWTTLGPVIRQFLNNGGSVIFLGSYSSESECMFNTGVFSGTFVQNAAAGFGDITVLDTTHPLTTGLATTSFNAPSATYTMNITNPDKVKLAEDEDGNDVVTYRYFGSGKAIFIAFDYFATTPESQKIIANAIEWGGENALPAWIHLNITGDTVNAAGTSTVEVTFTATALPAGTYYANLGIASNDPNDPLVVVPCTLTVSGLPIIGLSDACIDIGSVIQHTINRDTLRILNNGCDTLILNSVTSTSSAFTLNSNVPYLLPGAFTDVVITFEGTTVGPFSGSVSILNNDNDTSVCLTAVTTPAPVVSPSVSSVTNAIRACSDSTTSTFTISNTGVAGAGDLIFHLGALPSWVTATPVSDTIPVGTSVTITLNFFSDTLVGGPRTANLQIISNDPQAPTKTVGVTMNVDFNPCVTYSFTTNTCTGFATFAASSINTPTSWDWDFGDSTTANTEDPTHSFPANGNYTVRLIACNGAGCDTVIQTVNAIITGPAAMSCYPATANYCQTCFIGITHFFINRLPGDTLINNKSNDAVDGYANYTCTDTATLLTRYPYQIGIISGFTYDEKVKVWIDLNNDSYLDSVTELMFKDSTNHASIGTLFIPDYPTNAYGVPLRVRVASDYVGNPEPQPCLDLQYGQVEDYSIFLNFYNGIDDLARNTGFNVYPNPFSQSSTIDYTLMNSSDVSVEVYNIMGEKIQSFATNELQSSGKHSYQFNTASSGIYFVKLTVNNATSVKKIVKM